MGWTCLLCMECFQGSANGRGGSSTGIEPGPLGFEPGKLCHLSINESTKALGVGWVGIELGTPSWQARALTLSGKIKNDRRWIHCWPNRFVSSTRAHLIPSIGFGETNMYDQVANPEGSFLRKIQDWFTHTFTLAPPIFYSTRVIPYRKPLTVVSKSWIQIIYPIFWASF